VIGVRAYSEKANVIQWNGTGTHQYWTNVPSTYTTTSGHGVPYTITNDSYSTTYTTNLNATSYNVSSGNILRSMSVNATPVSMNYTNFDTGTGWGQKQEDKVTRVSFERGTLLTEMTMYYASDEALTEMGVDMNTKKKLGMPQAFDGYCKPPKDWNG
jgi:hypothetical protein